MFITLSFFAFHSVILGSAFSTFYTQGSLVQGQRLRDSGKLLTNSCAVLPSVSHGLLLQGTNSVISCTSSSDNRDGQTKEKYQFSDTHHFEIVEGYKFHFQRFILILEKSLWITDRWP